MTLLALSSPATAGVIAGLPARPGQGIELQSLTGALPDPHRAGIEVARLVGLGVLRLDRDGDQVQVSLDRDHLSTLAEQLCTDLPGERLVREHPALRPWVTAGRFTSWPSQPAKIEAVHTALADLFVSG